MQIMHTIMRDPDRDAPIPKLSKELLQPFLWQPWLKICLATHHKVKLG